MEEFVSKSQKKREAAALQKIGVNLIALSPLALDQMPLSAPLRQAIDDAKVTKTHEGKRRQAQLIGKLMRSADHEKISEAYNALSAGEHEQKALFKEAELWRSKLISNGKEALTEFISCYQQADAQGLRALLKKTHEEMQRGASTGASKALFRFIKDAITRQG